jgi:hypothetical protein
MEPHEVPIIGHVTQPTTCYQFVLVGIPQLVLRPRRQVVNFDSRGKHKKKKKKKTCFRVVRTLYSLQTHRKLSNGEEFEFKGCTRRVSTPGRSAHLPALTMHLQSDKLGIAVRVGVSVSAAVWKICTDRHVQIAPSSNPLEPA